MKTKKGQTGMWIVIIIVVILLVGIGVYLLEITKSTSTPVQANPTPTEQQTIIPSIQPTVTILSAPLTANTNEDIYIDWVINSYPGTTSHTAIHYGSYSVPNPTGPNDYPGASKYIGADKPVNIPGEFSTTIKILQSGIYYYRAHTVINGKDYWSNERMITIRSTPTMQTETTSSSGSSSSGSSYSYGY